MKTWSMEGGTCCIRENRTGVVGLRNGEFCFWPGQDCMQFCTAAVVRFLLKPPLGMSSEHRVQIALKYTSMYHLERLLKHRDCDFPVPSLPLTPSTRVLASEKRKGLRMK